MPLSPQSCQICGTRLYLVPEKKTGICDACRRQPQSAKCMKCGITLLAGEERHTSLCRRCAISEYRCTKCNRRLESAIERTGGTCNECKQHDTDSFGAKRR